MELGDILTRDGIVHPVEGRTKKAVLQELSEKAAQLTGLSDRDIFDALLQRERLGSTGLGRGIAIPHVKLRKLERIHCLFARLDQPIDFESLDGEPVDLIFLLLAPEHASGDHLKTLARISRLLREPRSLERLRNARDKVALHLALTAPATSHAA